MMLVALKPICTYVEVVEVVKVELVSPSGYFFLQPFHIKTILSSHQAT